MKTFPIIATLFPSIPPILFLSDSSHLMQNNPAMHFKCKNMFYSQRICSYLDQYLIQSYELLAGGSATLTSWKQSSFSPSIDTLYKILLGLHSASLPSLVRGHSYCNHIFSVSNSFSKHHKTFFSFPFFQNLINWIIFKLPI